MACRLAGVVALVRIAYFITAHKYPTQVGRLVSRIRTNEDSCTISVFNVRTEADKAAWAVMAPQSSDFVRRLRISSKNIWGSFDQVAENLDAMAFALNLGFDFYVNLSAQCYPLWPPHHIKAVLESSGKSHIEVKTYDLNETGEIVDKTPRTLGAVSHWHTSSMTVHRFTDWWLHPLWIDNRRVILRVPGIRRRLPLGLQPGFGSGWFCLTRAHVEAILQFVSLHPEVLRFFRHTGIPIENFFNTLVWSLADHESISNGNMRFESWTDEASQIPPISAADVPTVLASDALWARKFDPVSAPIAIDEIDRVRFGLK